MTAMNTPLQEVLKRYLPAPTERLKDVARKIIARDTISVHSYVDVPIGELFWSSGDHSNRSWQFSMHSFAPLDSLMSCGEWGEVLGLVDEWAADNGMPCLSDPMKFPWHDHATALRLDRLSLMRLVQLEGKYIDLARLHAEVLLNEDFYSRHTNHGYDQALALLLASYAFRDDHDTAQWRDVGLRRLIDELNFAFSSEGVHVENSPAYHVGMTANLLRAKAIKSLAEVESHFDFDSLIDKALLFTAWITGPDRKLALLGDSTLRSGLPPTDLSSFSNYKHALYSATGGERGAPPSEHVKLFEQTGYGVYRSNWSPWDDHVHLVMKCGFVSSYHRHDDDLNILLQGYGEHWLIDSGLYNHNQKDPVRIYMRSALAHNVPYIRGFPITRVPPTSKKASSLALENAFGRAAVFRAVSHMYKNAAVSRTVIVEDKDAFQIIDSFKLGIEEPQVFLQFHTPADKRIRTSPNVARIYGKRKSLVIRVAEGAVSGCFVCSGLEGEFKSVRSLQINQFQRSQVVIFGPINGVRIRFSLRFEDC